MTSRTTAGQRAARARRGAAPAPAPAPDRSAVVAIWLAVGSAAVVLPGGMDRFVLVKTLVVGAAVAVGVASSRAGRLPRWAVLGLAVGAGWLVLAALTSQAPLAQVFGRWPRYEGLVTLPAAVGALWLGARVLGPGAGPAARTAVERAAVAVSCTVGAFAIAEALGFEPISSTSARAGSLLGNASDQGTLGVLLCAVLLPGLFVAVDRTGRSARERARAAALPATGVGMGVVTVVTSGSRGALLGLVAAIGTVALIAALPRLRAGLATDAGDRWSPRGALAVPGVVLAGAAALALALPTMADRLTGASPLSSGTIEGRRLLWAETLRLVADHPLLGVGPSGYVEAIPAYHTAEWAIVVGSANPPDSPHSWPLQAAVAGGIPLLVLALALGVLGVVSLVRGLLAAADVTRDCSSDHHGDGAGVTLTGAAAAAAGYAVATAVGFTSPGTTGVLALLLGAGIAVSDAGRARTATAGARAAQDVGRPRRWPRAVGIAALAAWLLVVGAATAAEWPLRAAYAALDRGDVAAGGGADRAFATAQALRPWDGDVAVIAAHAFGTTAAAGIPEAAGPAAEWADRALEAIPTSALALAARADAAEALGDLDRADDLFTTLLARDPVNAEWPLRRGVVRANAGDLAAAEADFLLAAQLAPDTPGPWRNLSVLYDLMGRPDDAERAADEADRR